VVVCLFFVANLQGDEARDHLGKAANAYRRLKSFQVESIAEKRSSGEKSDVPAAWPDPKCDVALGQLNGW